MASGYIRTSHKVVVNGLLLHAENVSPKPHEASDIKYPLRLDMTVYLYIMNCQIDTFLNQNVISVI